ncbi:MAG: DUF1211 domain-containing protein [Pseudomonadales bacterium]|nr:DUF1211 domain-containing protein [Pseudomonadales bacterium]
MEPTLWNQARLATLPRHGYFRHRGESMTRLETFVDAAFAFAVTMLVISIDHVPENYDEFVQALLSIPAFLASFFQMTMFWMGHRTWSRRYGLDDRVAMWLSLALVAGILVIVYPLRVMFTAGMAYLSEGYLASPMIIELDELKLIFAVYGIGFGTLCGLICMLFIYALKKREYLALDELETAATRADVHAWCILSVTGFVSLMIALVSDGIWVVLAGWVYALLGVLMPLQAWVAGRRLRAAEPQPVLAPAQPAESD